MADLTNNEKHVMCFIKGYYAGTGEMPDESEIAIGLKANRSVIRFVLPLLERKGRLINVNGKYLIAEPSAQHRIHSDALPKGTKAIKFT